MEGLSSAGLSDEDEEMPRAFEVPTVVEELEEMGSAITAEQYLHSVRLEASKMPSVLISPMATSVSEAEEPQIVSDLGGGMETWAAGIDDFIAFFAELRLGLMDLNTESIEPCGNMPKSRDRRLWKVFCLGEDNQADAALESWTIKPLLNVVLSIDEPTTSWLLQQLIDWMVQAKQIFYRHSLWIFVLSSKVSKPLDDDTSASFRMLTKFCQSFLKDKNMCSEGDSVDHAKILLSIAGAYFGQDENLATCFANYQRI